MRKMFRKTAFVLLLTVVLFSSVFARSVYAQTGTPWYNQSYRVWAARVFDHTNDTEIFGERYTFAQVQWIIYSLMTIAAGSDTVSCMQFLNTGTADISTDAQEKFKECVEALQPAEEPGAYIGENQQYASILPYGPHNIASGVGYIKESINNFSLVPKVQAQGFGYGTLDPIQDLWRVMRNTAYLLLSIGIIILAFMVMFRVKISPQTVISVQSALPRIVAALLAITFSYAMVGLMIDLVYVIIGGMSVLLSASSLSDISSIEIYRNMITFMPLERIVLSYLLIATLILLVAGVALLIIPVVGWMGTILVIIIGFILVIAGLIILLKTAWILIKAFVTIVMYTIFSPIILLGILFSPGGTLSSWLRSLLANLAVFPLVGFMTYLAHFFFWSFVVHTGNQTINDIVKLISEVFLLDPYNIAGVATNFETAGTISMPVVPGVGGQNVATVGFILAIGILFLIPQAANIVKTTIERKPFAYGAAIGAGAAVAAAPATVGLGKTWGAVSGGIEKGFQDKIVRKYFPDPRRP